MLFDEPERDELVRRIAVASRRLISIGTLIETSIVVEARRGEVAGRELDLFLHRVDVHTVAVNEEQALLARAWRHYGKAATRRAEPRRSVRLRPRSSER